MERRLTSRSSCHVRPSSAQCPVHSECMYVHICGLLRILRCHEALMLLCEPLLLFLFFQANWHLDPYTILPKFLILPLMRVESIHIKKVYMKEIPDIILNPGSVFLLIDV